MALQIIFIILVLVTNVNGWRWYGGLQLEEKNVHDANHKHLKKIQNLKDSKTQTVVFTRDITLSDDPEGNQVPWKDTLSGNKHNFFHVNGAVFAEEIQKQKEHIYNQVVLSGGIPSLVTRATEAGYISAKDHADIDNWNIYFKNNGVYYVAQGPNGKCGLISINGLLQGPMYNNLMFEDIGKQQGQTYGYLSMEFLTKNTVGGMYDEEILYQALSEYKIARDPEHSDVKTGKNIDKLMPVSEKYLPKNFFGFLIWANGHVFSVRKIRTEWYILDGLPQGFFTISVWNTFSPPPQPKPMTSYKELLDALPKTYWADKYMFIDWLIRDPKMDVEQMRKHWRQVVEEKKNKKQFVFYLELLPMVTFGTCIGIFIWCFCLFMLGAICGWYLGGNKHFVTAKLFR